MKIAILVPANVSQDNGITVRAKRVFEVLKMRFDLVMISSKNQIFDNIAVILKEAIRWNLKLIYVLPKKKIDYLYCSSDFLGFFSYYIISKIVDIKIIFEAHGILSVENREKGSSKMVIEMCEFLEKFVVGHADYVVALSKEIFNFYGRYNKNIELIPVFLDESLYQKGDVEGGSSKLIGLIGPFDMPANKRFLEFLYGNIDRFDDRIKFAVIGTCNHKIKNDKIVYTGYIDSRQDYITQLSRLDALLLPSNIATSGPLNKILEAMACSLPVFTTSEGVSGLDYAEHGQNILVFKENELVDKINEMIFDDELMEEIGKNARNIVERHYSKKANEKKIMKILRGL